MSSIGITCAYPPPAAPPLIPKQGPSDGSRIATMERFPIFRNASARPTVVVGLKALDRLHANLRLERTIELQVLSLEFQRPGDCVDGLQLRFMRDIDVGLDRHRAAARLSSIHWRQILTASGAFAPYASVPHSCANLAVTGAPPQMILYFWRTPIF